MGILSAVRIHHDQLTSIGPGARRVTRPGGIADEGAGFIVLARVDVDTACNVHELLAMVMILSWPLRVAAEIDHEQARLVGLSPQAVDGDRFADLTNVTHASILAAARGRS